MAPVDRVTFGHVGSRVIRVAGEVDILTSAFLRQQLVDAAVHPGSLIVDLTGVTFMDATGLGVLVGAQKRAAAHGAEVLLVIDQPFLLRLFDLTGLQRAFRIYPSSAGAEAALVPLAS